MCYVWTLIARFTGIRTLSSSFLPIQYFQSAKLLVHFLQVLQVWSKVLSVNCLTMTDKRSSLRGPSDETWTRGCGRAPAPENLLRRALAAVAEAPRSSARCPWGKRIPAMVASRLTTSARPRQRARPSWFKHRLRAMNSSASKGSATTPHRRRGNGYDGVETEVGGGGGIQVWTIRISKLCRTIVERAGVWW